MDLPVGAAAGAGAGAAASAAAGCIYYVSIGRALRAPLYVHDKVCVIKYVQQIHGSIDQYLIMNHNIYNEKKNSWKHPAENLGGPPGEVSSEHANCASMLCRRSCPL